MITVPPIADRRVGGACRLWEQWGGGFILSLYQPGISTDVQYCISHLVRSSVCFGLGADLTPYIDANSFLSTDLMCSLCESLQTAHSVGRDFDCYQRSFEHDTWDAPLPWFCELYGCLSVKERKWFLSLIPFLKSGKYVEMLSCCKDVQKMCVLILLGQVLSISLWVQTSRHSSTSACFHA